jgi:hypothetical protein
MYRLAGYRTYVRTYARTHARACARTHAPPLRAFIKCRAHVACACAASVSRCFSLALPPFLIPNTRAHPLASPRARGLCPVREASSFQPAELSPSRLRVGPDLPKHALIKCPAHAARGRGRQGGATSDLLIAVRFDRALPLETLGRNISAQDRSPRMPGMAGTRGNQSNARVNVAGSVSDVSLLAHVAHLSAFSDSSIPRCLE